MVLDGQSPEPFGAAHAGEAGHHRADREAVLREQGFADRPPGSTDTSDTLLAGGEGV
jgi:hypothetical protein